MVNERAGINAGDDPVGIILGTKETAAESGFLITNIPRRN